MHIQKDYYICDHCKSEIPPNQIRVVSIPVEDELETRRTVKTVKIELCKDCSEKLLHLIRNRFHRFHCSYDGKLIDEEENEDE